MMIVPTAQKVEVMKTVLEAHNQMRVGTGKYYYRAKCPLKDCKHFGMNEGQNEHGIVMRCSCGELFLAHEPGTEPASGRG